MTNTYDDDDEWSILNAPTNDHDEDDGNDQNQGYQALLDPDEEE